MHTRSVGSYTLPVFCLQPLPTKLVLRKKRAKEGRSGDEVEHFPIPARVTVRRRPTVSVVELQDAGVRVSTYIYIYIFLLLINSRAT